MKLFSGALFFYPGMLLLCLAGILLLFCPRTVIAAVNRSNELLGFPGRIPLEGANATSSKIGGLTLLLLSLYLIIASAMR